MNRPTVLATLAGASLLSNEPAFAHGFAGPHMFISTLLIDDPNVADEASLPTFMWLDQPRDGSQTPALYNLGFEFDKRITENFGFSVSDGYNWLHMPGAKTATGWDNVEATLKYKPYVSAEHEFMVSIGVSREFARTGATGANGAVLDVDDTSSTTPTIYWGKGFGDLPIGFLRPLALTGTLGYTQYLFGVGVNYTADWYAVGVEALIPGNKQTGSHAGVIAQFHLYFDDLFPHSLGKPIVGWFQ